jgi:hypothetical protein
MLIPIFMFNQIEAIWLKINVAEMRRSHLFGKVVFCCCSRASVAVAGLLLL